MLKKWAETDTILETILFGPKLLYFLISGSKSVKFCGWTDFAKIFLSSIATGSSYLELEDFWS